jgi:hypothetical protein
MSDALIGPPPGLAQVDIQLGRFPILIEVTSARIGLARITGSEEVEQVSQMEGEDLDREVHRKQVRACRFHGPKGDKGTVPSGRARDDAMMR